MRWPWAASVLETPDLAVLGAGPAGIRAALAARAADLSVLLVDEAPFAGGQGAYRARWDGVPGYGADGRRGDRLRRALAASGVPVLPSHRVWTASTAPIRLSLAGPGATRTVQPRALLVAAGATERVLPFPGWTLPGVIGLGAATVLLKSPGPLSAGPAVVAGRGAAGISGGGRVAGPWRFRFLRGGRGQPGRLAPCNARLGGAARSAVPRRVVAGTAALGWREGAARPCGGARLGLGRRASGPWCGRWVSRTGRSAWCRPALLAVGHGLMPATELLSLLGVELRHRPEEGAWVPVVGRGGRTNVPGLYAAGDGTGIRGAQAAELAGHLAGLAVAEDLGALPGARRRTVAAGSTVAPIKPGGGGHGSVDDAKPSTGRCHCARNRGLPLRGRDARRDRRGAGGRRLRPQPAQDAHAVWHGAVPGPRVRPDRGGAGGGCIRIARSRCAHGRCARRCGRCRSPTLWARSATRTFPASGRPFDQRTIARPGCNRRRGDGLPGGVAPGPRRHAGHRAGSARRFVHPGPAASIPGTSP